MARLGVTLLVALLLLVYPVWLAVCLVVWPCWAGAAWCWRKVRRATDAA